MGAKIRKVERKTKKLVSFFAETKYLHDLYLVDVYITVHHSIDGEGGNALQTELVHNILTMGDDGGQPDVELIGNLFVDKSLYDERHDFYLAVAENLLLQCLRHWWQVAPFAMCILDETQQLADELCLGLVDAETVEIRQLGCVVELEREHNGLALPFLEERPLL